MNSPLTKSSLFLLCGALGVNAVAMSAFATDTAEVVLTLHQNVSMTDLAKSVNDPASPRYRNYYSPQEIRALAAPSDADYQKLLTQLKSHGVTIVSESPSHLILTVSGDRSYLTQLQAQMKSAVAARAVTSNAVASVEGLNPSSKRRPHLQFRAKDGTDNGGMLPAEIRKLYGFDSIYAAGFTGRGQHIAIATYSGFLIKDVQDYYTMNKLSPGPQIDQVAFNGTAVYDQGSAAETQTDAEFSGMIAPGASIHVFASAENSEAGELQMFTAILDDNRAKIVNYSWGSCEDTTSPDHKTAMDLVFARAVAQGVNIMVASGDSGSDCDQNGTVMADFPASNPNVVAVGGTTLTDTNGVASEAAWNGSGGGISTLYAKPDYQARLSATTYTGRAYPDVAFNADPASGQPTWIHYDPTDPTAATTSATYVVIGGTSIAAPQWSGFLALVGEARGAKTLGSLHSALYPIPDASLNKYLNESLSGSNGAYTAGPIWNAVTGFGSMHADPLFTYLRNL